MAWVTQTKDETTFGSVVRYKGVKYIFLRDDHLIKLIYYTFTIVDASSFGIDNNAEWEVWKDPDLFQKLDLPNQEAHDSCALGILDKLSET